MTFFGDLGDDELTVFGGDGNRLEGGRGNDDHTGGSGQDNFVYVKSESGDLGRDTISGFEDNKDKVLLDGYTLDDLAIDNLNQMATLSDGTTIRFDGFTGTLTEADFVVTNGIV